MRQRPASPVVTAERESFGTDSSIKRSKTIFFQKIFLIFKIFSELGESLAPHCWPLLPDWL